MKKIAVSLVLAASLGMCAIANAADSDEFNGGGNLDADGADDGAEAGAVEAGDATATEATESTDDAAVTDADGDAAEGAESANEAGEEE